MQTTLKGKTMLKVVGILMIVFAAVNILTGLLAIGGGALLGAAGGEMGAALGVMAGATGALLILASVLDLVFGILAVKWCNRAEKAGALFVLGIILAVLAVIGLVMSLGGEGLVGSIVDVVLAVLYILGAHQNKQGA